MTNAAGITELVAAVVLAPGVAMAEIAAVVKTVLKPHMQPNRVVVVDALPRTEQGKLRRRAVAEQLGSAQE